MSPASIGSRESGWKMSPTLSLNPYWVTMAVARSVAPLRSDEAPVLM